MSPAMPKLQRLAAAMAFVFAAAGFTAPAARADVTVDVNPGVLQPLPIAIPDFGGPQGAEIAKVVENDLEGSGLFRPLDHSTFQETPNVNIQPQFAVWKQINAQALLDGQTSTDSDGRLVVNFRLWDIFSQNSLIGYQFASTPDNWRRLAHKISDAVYERL